MRSAVMGLGWAAATGIWILVAAAGCNWMAARPAPNMRQGLVVRCNKPATLFLNERMVGTLSRPKGMRVGLPPGSYRLVLRLPGYFTRYLDVKVKKDRYKVLTVLMRRELD